jgi:protein involved in temperature-dependent protein secretion
MWFTQKTVSWKKASKAVTGDAKAIGVATPVLVLFRPAEGVETDGSDATRALADGNYREVARDTGAAGGDSIGGEERGDDADNRVVLELETLTEGSVELWIDSNRIPACGALSPATFEQ